MCVITSCSGICTIHHILYAVYYVPCSRLGPHVKHGSLQSEAPRGDENAQGTGGFWGNAEEPSLRLQAPPSDAGGPYQDFENPNTIYFEGEIESISPLK